MTTSELLVDFHKDATRQGPGSTADTLKALSFIDLEQGKPLKVLDIGCGTGAQTLVLGQNIEGTIIAVDLFPEFLAQLATQAKALGLQEKIITLEKSMEDLSFEQETFDVIWSEGAIYVVGFEQGIKEWKEYLNPGGYIALSEITWTTQSRPKEIEVYWVNEYPQIATASKKMKILEENGFSPIGYFFLPQHSWLENYYDPMVQRMNAFLEKHQYTDLAKDIVADEKAEISNYKKYKNYYSYGFYIAKKVVPL